MIYLLKSKMIPTTGRLRIRPKTEAGLFDSIAHHLKLRSASLTMTSRGHGCWAIWHDDIGFIGRAIELEPREDMQVFRGQARAAAKIISKEGL